MDRAAITVAFVSALLLVFGEASFGQTALTREQCTARGGTVSRGPGASSSCITDGGVSTTSCSGGATLVRGPVVSYCLIGPIGDAPQAACSGVAEQANAVFEAYRASVRAVARTQGSSDYEPYCNALEAALRANEAADAATRRVLDSGCKTDAVKNIALLLSDKSQLREGLPACRSNAEKQKAEREAKLRETTLDNILNSRTRNNTGQNDIGRYVPPASPSAAAALSRPASPRPQPEGPSPDSSTGAVAGDSEISGEEPQQTPPRTANCGWSDVYPHLGRCIVRQARDLRQQGEQMVDHVIDHVFPPGPRKDDPFAGE